MYVTTNRTSVQPVSIRTEYLDGRSYWVAPLVMIVEGIHTGSSGPVFYSSKSLALSAAAWNMKPIVVYHPQDSDGKFITAANKATIENQQVGLLFNVRFDGKLRADAWIDQAKSFRVDRRVEKAIDSQQVMEVSTGLYFDPVLESGTWQGKYFN